jgi:hypothetical protein
MLLRIPVIVPNIGGAWLIPLRSVPEDVIKLKTFPHPITITEAIRLHEEYHG